MAKSKVSDIVVLLFGILSATAGMIYAVNQWDKNGKSAKELLAKRAELKSIQVRAAFLPTLRQKNIENSKRLEKLNHFIPDKEGQAEFVIELDKIVKRCGLELTDCNLKSQPLSYKSLPKFIIYRWNISLKGDYRGIESFLTELPKEERYIMVAEMSLSSGNSDSEKMTGMSYQLTAKFSLDLVTAPPSEKVKP